MKNKKFLGIIALIIMIFIFVGCGDMNAASVDDNQAKQTERIMTEINNQVGLPDISNFFEKKTAKDIYELRDDADLITYAYMQNLDGRFVYLGQCIGFGLPYSVQYSNPQKVSEREYDLGEAYGVLPMPQAEPNGLFMPEGLSATWLMYVNPDTGKREIIYSEPSIVVTQSKLPIRLCAEWSLPTGYNKGFIAINERIKEVE